jgi:16S rRNA (cytidine1402-2'-O)-methyltransferase
MGILYLVSTPIGNLRDITLRALEILAEVDIIACEDTRKTGFLLRRLKISNKAELLSFYEENESKRIPQLIRFLKEGKDIALVSNAGTPAISDPGFKLVRQAVEQEIKVEAVPGASAVLAALVSSGLPTDKFVFLGYLPRKQGKREKIFQNLLSINQLIGITVVFFESPYRLLKTLADLKKVFGDIEIVTARELTKIHEEIRKEKVSQAINFFEKNKPKGEFTLLFNISRE